MQGIVVIFVVRLFWFCVVPRRWLNGRGTVGQVEMLWLKSSDCILASAGSESRRPGAAAGSAAAPGQ